MLASMEPGQFDEWRAFYDIEPWGDDWVQAAQTTAAVINASGPEMPVNPADLVPTYDRTHRTDEVPSEQLGSRWRARLGA